MHTWAPALLAIAAALLIAGGTVLRQRSSAASGAITGGWWVGAAVALAGFFLQASALGLGSILLVQPLVVLAVLFALPLEAWADHRSPHLSEWLWGGVLVACVVTFLVVARPRSTDRRPDVMTMGLTVGAIIGGIVALVLIAERCSSRTRKALCYGLASGVLFGVSAILIKAVAFRVIDNPISVLGSYEVYLLVPVILLAIAAQQRGFGSGDLQTSFPAMNVMEPAVAMILGIALLGENITVGPVAAIFLVIVLGLSVVAVIRLAQHAAIRGDQRGKATDPASAEAVAVSGQAMQKR